MSRRPWRGVTAAVAVVAIAAFSGCVRDESAGRPDVRVKLDRVTVSGVSVGYPREWRPCLVPGIVPYGELVNVHPPELSSSATNAPLSILVGRGARTFEEMLRFDRETFSAWADVRLEDEAVDVRGARETSMIRYEGTETDDAAVGTSLYALADSGRSVRLSLSTHPQQAEDFEPIFFELVESLDLDAAGEPDTVLPECSLPDVSSPESEQVPEDLAGDYAMKLTAAERKDVGLAADDPSWWALRLQGGQLKVVGARKPASKSITLDFPILQASRTRLVVGGNTCDGPPGPMPIEVDLRVTQGRLFVEDVSPACPQQFHDLLTINVWRKLPAST